MIESWEQCFNFFRGVLHSELLLHLVPLHDGPHPAENLPCVLFIKDLSSGKVYYYGFDHPDVKTPKPVDHTQFIELLNQLPARKWAVDKKSMMQLIPLRGLLDVNLAGYLYNNTVFEVSEFDTLAHTLIRRNSSGKPKLNRFVPLMKHLEMFTELSEVCEKNIKRAVIDDPFEYFNKEIIEPLAEVEKIGLAIDPKIFCKHFPVVDSGQKMVFTQYNVYTSTGRPSNRFGGVNYAALNKEDGTRKSFVSRFGSNGQLVLVDYSAFHPRIIARLLRYDLGKDVDIYEYLARLYFNKKVPDELDISEAKKITFRQLYGGVEKEYSHIKYLSHLKEFIDEKWSFFNQHGYVETPIFKRRITSKHIQAPKPATVFNYILQAAEGELSIPVLGKVSEYLRDKKTKAVLYTYDSILFDACLSEDIAEVLSNVLEIMSFQGTFPMKVYIGPNYHDMEQADIKLP